MAENLIILLILAAIIGAFWLVLLTAVWRRYRRALWNRSKVDASMKKVRWTLALLGAVGALLVLSVVLPGCRIAESQVHRPHRDHQGAAWPAA